MRLGRSVTFKEWREREDYGTEEQSQTFRLGVYPGVVGGYAHSVPSNSQSGLVYMEGPAGSWHDEPEGLTFGDEHRGQGEVRSRRTETPQGCQELPCGIFICAVY